MQDGVNVPVIEPRVVMELPTNPGGLMPGATLRFAGDSLYVVDPVWNDPPTRIVWWYATPVASVVLPFAVALALWLLWRLLSRPRRRGLIYCRGCNHELSQPNATIGPDGRGAWANENARCPECGRRSKPPLVAGATWRRMIPTFAAVALLMGCAVSLFSTLKWVASPLPSYEQTWPVKGLEKYLGSWAVMRRDNGYFGTAMNRIVRVPLRGGPPRELSRDRIPLLLGELASPSEQRLVLTPLDRRGALRIVEASTGRSRFVDLDTNPGASTRVLQFSNDGRSVFVQVDRHRFGESDRLVRVWLDSGSVDVLAEHRRLLGVSAGTGRVLATFVVRERGDEVRWAYAVSPDRTYPRGPLIIWWSDANAVRRVEAAIGCDYDTRFSWHPDFSRIVVSSRAMPLFEHHVSLLGGQHPLQSRIYPYQGVERGVGFTREEGGFRMHDRRQVPVGVLRGGDAVDRSFPQFEVSSDGHWAAAYISTDFLNAERPAALPPPRPGVRGEIWLWNLCEGHPIQN
jgi:hypothetical protein